MWVSVGSLVKSTANKPSQAALSNPYLRFIDLVPFKYWETRRKMMRPRLIADMHAAVKGHLTQARVLNSLTSQVTSQSTVSTYNKLSN
jgi:hypothetical protein